MEISQINDKFSSKQACTQTNTNKTKLLALFMPDVTLGFEFGRIRVDDLTIPCAQMFTKSMFNW